MEKQYLQFDINDARAGLIAEVLSNKTCKKILALLSEKEMSESDIAKQLKIPANTANYNMQKLVASGLVETANKFFWSIKGKKVPIYKLSNKKVIISPKTSFKGVIPALVTTGIAAILVKVFTASRDSAQAVASNARDASVGKIAESYSFATDVATSMPGQVASDVVVQQGNIMAVAPWSWFLLGAWVGLLVFVLFNMRRNSSD